MRRSIVLALIWFAAVEPTFACICLDRLSVRKARNDADAVFVARVSEVRPVACDFELKR